MGLGLLERPDRALSDAARAGSEGAQLIGRERELATSARFLDVAADGPAGLIFEGEPGIGKTALWNATLERAASRRCQVLSYRAVRSEAKLSFVALADLLAGVPDQLIGDLPEPQRRALEVALLRVDPGGSPPDQRAISMGFLSVLAALGRSATVIVAVDDVQWIDGPSARVLEFAARRIEGRAVGILLSLRTAGDVRVPLALDRALDEKRLERVPVGPLSLAALHHLIAARLGHVFPRPTLVRIDEASGGNPFFALETARALLRSGSEGMRAEALPVPDTLKELVADRIQTLPARTRDALVVAAAASQPTVDVVNKAMPDSGGDGAAALTTAQEAGIIEIDGGRVRFTHALLSSTVYSQAGSDRRRKLHRLLGDLVGDVEERARHLALAASGPDEKVAAALDEAAVLASARGAPDAAAGLCEQAVKLTLPDDPGHVARRRAQAAEYHFAAGDTGRARTLLDQVVASAPPGPARAAALRQLAEVRYHDDSYPEATCLLRDALDEAGDDPRLRARIELDLAWGIVAGADVPGAEPHARAAVALAEEVGDRTVLAESLAGVAMVDFLRGRGMADDQIQRAVELEEPVRRIPIQRRPAVLYGLMLMATRRLDEAAATLEKVHAQVRERGEESALPLLLLFLTELECWRGNIEVAAAYAEEGHRAAVQTGGDAVLAAALCSKALVHSRLGDVEAARKDAQDSLDLLLQTGWTLASLWPLGVLGFVELSIGDHAAVDRVLGPLIDFVAGTGAGDPSAAPFIADEMEALVGLGKLDRAAHLLARLETESERSGRPWAVAAAARCRALLLAAEGDLDAASHAIEEALAIQETLDLPYELARALLVKGQIHRRNKEKLQARASIERAVALFEELGSAAWAQRARRELARTGVRAAPQELTETERRVAELVARGLSNREVAQKLFVSPKTVEANLSRAYRKLGIRSRAELRRRSTRHGTTPN